MMNTVTAWTGLLVATCLVLSAQTTAESTVVARCYIADPSWTSPGCNGHRKYMSSSVSTTFTTLKYCVDPKYQSGNGQMWLMSISDQPDPPLDNLSAKARFNILMGPDHKNCIGPGSDTWCSVEGAEHVRCNTR